MSGFSELSWVSKGDQGILTIQDIGLTVQCADTNLILLISYSISPPAFSNILQQCFSISALLMHRDQIILHCLDHPVNCRILAASLTISITILSDPQFGTNKCSLGGKLNLVENHYSEGNLLFKH